jgi:hypothetical protein
MVMMMAWMLSMPPHRLEPSWPLQPWRHAQASATELSGILLACLCSLNISPDSFSIFYFNQIVLNRRTVKELVSVLDNIELNHPKPEDRVTFKNRVEMLLLNQLIDRVVDRSGSDVVPDLLTSFFAPAYQRPQNKLGVEANADGDPVRMSTQCIRNGKNAITSFIKACFKSQEAFWPALHAFLVDFSDSYKKFLPAKVRRVLRC